MNYQDINADTIDSWIKNGWKWGKPIDHEVYSDALDGNWDVFLTPLKPVPHRWFPDLKNKKLLGLASGGGQQMPILSALGSECTVLDYSEQQLESERLIAEREGYDIRIVRADMTKPLPFHDEEFDIIFNPVSTCYIREVEPLFRECYRILKHGGCFMTGFDKEIVYAFDDDYEKLINHMPFDPLKNDEQMKQLKDGDSGVQFSHTLEEQIGGQLDAGFVITDIYEDMSDEKEIMTDLGIKEFVALRSIK